QPAAFGPAPASRSHTMPIPQPLPLPQEGGTVAPSALSSRRAPVPWVPLGVCAAAGAAAMVVVLLTMDAVVPSPSALGAKLAQWWGIYQPYSGPGEYMVSGHKYPGPAPLWLVVLMRFGVGMLPFLLLGVVMFAVFHRIALSGRARAEGMREG